MAITRTAYLVPSPHLPKSLKQGIKSIHNNTIFIHHPEETNRRGSLDEYTSTDARPHPPNNTGPIEEASHVRRNSTLLSSFGGSTPGLRIRTPLAPACICIRRRRRPRSSA